MKFLRKAILSLGLLALMVPSLAHADSVDSSKKMVDTLATEAIAIISKDGSSVAQQKAAFGKLLKRYFDTNKIGKFALGRYRRQATPEQMTEYTKLFDKMIVDVYTQRFQEYSGQTIEVTDGYKDEQSGDIVVKSLIKGSGSPIAVDWRVRNNKIIDVIVEGVSLSITKRDDFASTIKKGGGKVDALITHLKQ